MIEEIVNNFNIIIVAISFLLFDLIFTGIFKTNKTNWGNFWKVWMSMAVVMAIIITFMILRPELLYDALIKLKELIGL